MNTLVGKSFTIKGNLLNDKFVYSPIGNELSAKYKYIAIGSITFMPKVAINTSFGVSCNYVTHEHFNPVPIIDTYEDTLQVFKVKYRNNEDGAIVSRFTPVWFAINSLSEKLEFTFKNLLTEEAAKVDSDVIMIVFLK